MNQVDLWDRAVEVFQGLSEYADIKAQVDEALMTDKETCGHCDHWMKSSICPRERNVNGRSAGPSMSGVTCNKYVLQEWVRELKVKRLKELKKHPYYKKFDKDMINELEKLIVEDK